ncbi:MAG: hypothetical protein L6Q77_09510 [Bacteroidetes bacterium]|nr:hypothetical protein [Bacteroidota bacterium]
MTLPDLPVDSLFSQVFSSAWRNRIEKFFLVFAVVGFLIHLGLIYLNLTGLVPFPEPVKSVFHDPISSLYTPFSFILAWEVYLLVYYLPESLTISIGKLYEITALIVIRRIFKDISHLTLTEDWFSVRENGLLTADLGGILVLLLLIFYYYRLQKAKPKLPAGEAFAKFIRLKKAFSILLLPVLAVLFLWSFWNWGTLAADYIRNPSVILPDVNYVFYHDFFTLLICVDVLLLIISFRYIERFSQLIRNSGFIISSVLIRISFSSDGFLTIILTVTGVAFGVAILQIFNLMEKPGPSPAGK